MIGSVGVWFLIVVPRVGRVFPFSIRRSVRGDASLWLKLIRVPSSRAMVLAVMRTKAVMIARPATASIPVLIGFV